MKKQVMVLGIILITLFSAGMVMAQNTSNEQPELQMQVDDSYDGLRFSSYGNDSHFIGSALFVDDQPNSYHVRMNDGENDFLMAQIGVKTKANENRITRTFSFDKLVMNDAEVKMKKKYALFVRDKSGNEIVQRYKINGSTHLKIEYDVSKDRSTVYSLKNGNLKQTKTMDGFVPIVLYTKNGKVFANVGNNE